MVLYKDGNLKYFESPDSHVADECIRLKVDCIRIENGTAVGTLVLITSLQNTVGNKTQNCFDHFDIYQAVSFLLFFSRFLIVMLQKVTAETLCLHCSSEIDV